MHETENLEKRSRVPLKPEPESMRTVLIDEEPEIDSSKSETQTPHRSYSQELSFSTVNAEARMTYWKKRKEFIEKYKKTAQSDIHLIAPCAARAIANVIDRFDDCQANVKTAVYQQLNFDQEDIETEEPVKEYAPDRNNDLKYELHLVQS